MRVAALVLVAAACFAAFTTADLGVTVVTELGPVKGQFDTEWKVFEWRGIPYAANAGGANRFLPPQPSAGWKEPYDVTHWGPGCVQYVTNADAPKEQSEDCLHVNVFAPQNAHNLPVMVWIHGGGFKEGSNIGPYDVYDGRYMAARGGVVVVTINYRLGSLGFLVTGNGDIKGNLGFLDQQAALKWVRRNIVNFGGNPESVTLFGESAGAMSIGLHMQAPGSKGLFHRVIQQSNPLAIVYKDLSGAAVVGKQVCKLAGCGTNCDMACMRKVPVDKLMAASKTAQGQLLTTLESNYRHILGGALQFTPTVDGTIIPQQVLTGLQSGNYWAKNMPMIIGSNADEGTTFVYAAIEKKVPMLAADAALVLIWPTHGLSMLKMYKQSSDTDGRQPLSRLATDYLFTCPTQEFAIATRKAGQKAFVYQYQHIFSIPSLFKGLIPDECATKACHASELPLIFHNGPTLPTGQYTALSKEEDGISNAIIDYWTNFAKTGDPNSALLPKWPVWDASLRNTLVLGAPNAVGKVINLNNCQLWAAKGWKGADGSSGPTSGLSVRFAEAASEAEVEAAEDAEDAAEDAAEDEDEAEEDAEDAAEAEAAEEQEEEAEDEVEDEAEGEEIDV